MGQAFTRSRGKIDQINPFIHLPQEIFYEICSYLNENDIKSLRFTNKHLNELTRHYLNSFVSPTKIYNLLSLLESIGFHDQSHVEHRLVKCIKDGEKLVLYALIFRRYDRVKNVRRMRLVHQHRTTMDDDITDFLHLCFKIFDFLYLSSLLFEI